MMTDYRVVFTKKQEAQLVERSFDDCVQSNEIMGQNILSLISTGSERGGFTTDFPASSYPMQTGSSSIAKVIKTGPDVQGFRQGDLFFHNENHTLFVKVKSDDAIAVPKGVLPEKALFGRYAAVSMTSIYNMKAKAVDNIIVTGLGMVGMMCAQALNCFGFRAYAVDPSAERRQIAMQAGLVHVGAALDEFADLLHNAGALMECSGNENALRAALPYLRKGGEIFQIGVPWHKNSDWDAHSLLYDLFYAFVSLHGGWEWSLPKKSGDFALHSSYQHIRTAMELIAEGKITVPESMYELRDAHECGAVYNEICIPRMRPTSMLLDWRNF